MIKSVFLQFEIILRIKVGFRNEKIHWLIRTKFDWNMTKISLLGQVLHFKSLFSIPNLSFTALTQFLSFYTNNEN